MVLKLPALNVVMEVLACNTCHSSYETCPECGIRLILNHPEQRITCTVCKRELKEIGKHITPGECMGFEGTYETPVYKCPLDHTMWCSETHEPLPEVYVKEFSKPTREKE
jgi:hypothetical protein